MTTLPNLNPSAEIDRSLRARRRREPWAGVAVLAGIAILCGGLAVWRAFASRIEAERAVRDEIAALDGVREEFAELETARDTGRAAQASAEPMLDVVALLSLFAQNWDEGLRLETAEITGGSALSPRMTVRIAGEADAQEPITALMASLQEFGAFDEIELEGVTRTANEQLRFALRCGVSQREGEGG
ncbi:MAG: hypothetical protein AAFR38_07315 [Planctomycetota bacterium]